MDVDEARLEGLRAARADAVETAHRLVEVTRDLIATSRQLRAQRRVRVRTGSPRQAPRRAQRPDAGGG